MPSLAQLLNKIHRNTVGSTVFVQVCLSGVYHIHSMYYLIRKRPLSVRCRQQWYTVKKICEHSSKFSKPINFSSQLVTSTRTPLLPIFAKGRKSSCWRVTSSLVVSYSLKLTSRKTLASARSISARARLESIVRNTSAHCSQNEPGRSKSAKSDRERKDRTYFMPIHCREPFVKATR